MPTNCPRGRLDPRKTVHGSFALTVIAGQTSTVNDRFEVGQSMFLWLERVGLACNDVAPDDDAVGNIFGALLPVA